MVRLIHFSDVHIFEPAARWKARDFLGKRVTGFFNNRYLRRGKLFKKAPEVLEQLVQKIRELEPDRVLFSGDATTLGTREEFESCVKLLKVSDPSGPKAMAVPGNHDYYSSTGRKAGWFESYFAPWQQGLRVDHHSYPYAQVVGHLFIAAVNSCQWNRWPWDSTGLVDTGQLERLQRLLQLPEGEGKTKIILTHYPIRIANEKHEPRHRRLRNLPQVLDAIRPLNVSLWLHGHRHGSYHHFARQAEPLSICAGSGTQKNNSGFNLIEMQHSKPEQIKIVTYEFSSESGDFRQRFSHLVNCRTSLPSFS